MKEYLSVFQAKVARKLLKEGYLITDIKPDRENKDKSVFVFKNELGLLDRIYQIAEEMKKSL